MPSEFTHECTRGIHTVTDRLANGSERGTERPHEANENVRAENEAFRERNAELEARLAAVEAELGLDATADRQGVADD